MCCLRSLCKGQWGYCEEGECFRQDMDELDGFSYAFLSIHDKASESYSCQLLIQ
jgi:hypothetical protein